MNFIKDWYSYNPKNILAAKEFVESNLIRLSNYLDSDKYTEEEKKKILIDYFTKYPDQIGSIRVGTIGSVNQLMAPSLNNIGGVIKYK